MIDPPHDAGSNAADPRILALLAERTAALAQRSIATAPQAATHPYLVCTSGDDRYGLPLGAVAQVVPARSYTAVPGAPPELLGLVALSGRVVSVLSLAGALGRPVTADRMVGTGHIVVIRGGVAPVAFAVDRVLAVADVDSALSADPLSFGGLGADAVSGYAPASGEEAAREGGDVGFVVIDLPRLLRRYLPQA